MCVGVATANSILVVSFAKEKMEEGMNSTEAALACRLHPIPSRHYDSAGDDHRHGPDGFGLRRWRRENAPLGRAVIGGLLLATFGTLTFVPTFFAFMHRNDPSLTESPGNGSEDYL